jgi:diaminopimelate epimerase
MKNIEFVKMHGLGNDFVIIDGRKQLVENPAKLARFVNNRKLGVGCDQMIVLHFPKNGEDVTMRIFNLDGSEAESCGNATRCVADILMMETGKDHVTIETLGGLLKCWKAGTKMVTVDMGEPRFKWNEIPLSRETDTLHMPVSSDHGYFPERLPVGVNVGNPHCVFFMDDVERVDLQFLGKETECYNLFPERINVEVATIKDRSNIRMRVWERGAGITLACGSGACATVVAAIRRGYTDRTATVHMDGGDLTVEWREADNHVYMTGPVAYVFTGALLGMV